jgi:hypothetical protein
LRLQPYVQGSLNTITDPTGACPNDPKQQQDGVAITSTFGVSLIAEVDPVNKPNSPLAAFTVAVSSLSFY